MGSPQRTSRPRPTSHACRGGVPVIAHAAAWNYCIVVPPDQSIVSGHRPLVSTGLVAAQCRFRRGHVADRQNLRSAVLRITIAFILESSKLSYGPSRGQAAQSPGIY